MTHAFGEVRARTLREEVARRLRNAIVTGKLKPGDHLKEAEIGNQMSVSRSPVREALRELEQEGLVVGIPNQGSFVRVIDEQDVEEILTLRLALENLACRLVVERCKFERTDFDRLQGYIEQQREAIEAGDFDNLIRLDVEFHEFICMKSGYGRLLKMWRSLRGQIEFLMYHLFNLLDWIPETVVSDHLEIVDALRQGDVSRCIQINNGVNSRVTDACFEILSLMRNAEVN